MCTWVSCRPVNDSRPVAEVRCRLRRTSSATAVPVAATAPSPEVTGCHCLHRLSCRRALAGSASTRVPMTARRGSRQAPMERPGRWPWALRHRRVGSASGQHDRASMARPKPLAETHHTAARWPRRSLSQRSRLCCCGGRSSLGTFRSRKSMHVRPSQCQMPSCLCEFHAKGFFGAGRVPIQRTKHPNVSKLVCVLVTS